MCGLFKWLWYTTLYMFPYMQHWTKAVLFFKARERDQDCYVAVLFHISLWHETLMTWEHPGQWGSFGMCIQCCSPPPTLGATFWHLLITIPSLRREQRRMIFQLFSPFFSFRPVTAAFENSRFPLDVKESMLWLLCVLHILSMVWTRLRVSTVNSMFRFQTKISQKVIQRSALTVDNHEWHERWEKTGQLLNVYSHQWFGSTPLNNCRILI